MEEWKRESILWWQRFVCREYIQLEPVVAESERALQKSYEFRTFWYKGQLVGCGKYWVAVDYDIGDEGYKEISNIGSIVSNRLKVPFLVIDFAKSIEGRAKYT